MKMRRFWNEVSKEVLRAVIAVMMTFALSSALGGHGFAAAACGGLAAIAVVMFVLMDD